MRKRFLGIYTLCCCVGVLWSVQAQGQFTQEGKAAYYADKFQGRTTASGDRYDANKHTCAHMSLPFGTVLEVENLDNGKKTLVRVNDRGPFSPNRIIDLSRIAAQELDIISSGIGRVRITSVPASRLAEGNESTTLTTSAETVTPAPAKRESTPSTPPVAVTPAAPAAPVSPTVTEEGNASAEVPESSVLYSLQVTMSEASGFAVQIASYNSLANALQRIAGFSPVEQRQVRLMVDESSGIMSVKLLFGPYKTRAEAQKQKEALGSQYAGCFIITLP